MIVDKFILDFLSSILYSQFFLLLLHYFFFLTLWEQTIFCQSLSLPSIYYSIDLGEDKNCDCTRSGLCEGFVNLT